MDSLKDQVKEFVKFDEVNSSAHTFETWATQNKFDSDMANAFMKGARFEHSRLVPLLELLPDVVEALEKIAGYRKDKGTCLCGRNESCSICLNPSDYTQNNLAHETLAKIKEAVGGKV